MRRFSGLLVFLALLVLVPAQASTPEALLDELGKSPGLNVIQVNETSYLFCPAAY